MIRVLCLVLAALLCAPAALSEEAESAPALPEDLAPLLSYVGDVQYRDGYYDMFASAVWNELPENFRKLLVRRKAKIVLYSGTEEVTEPVKHEGEDDFFGQRVVYGLYIHGKRPEIRARFPKVISGRSRGRLTIRTVFVHELGHLVDDLGGNGSFQISRSKAWKKIVSDPAFLEKLAYYDKQSRDNNYDDQERFADAFRIRLTEPDWFDDFPQAEELIDDAVDKTMKKYKIR